MIKSGITSTTGPYSIQIGSRRTLSGHQPLDSQIERKDIQRNRWRKECNHQCQRCSILADIAFHALTNAKPPDTNYLVEESKKLNSYIRTLDGFFCLSRWEIEGKLMFLRPGLLREKTQSKSLHRNEIIVIIKLHARNLINWPNGAQISLAFSSRRIVNVQFIPPVKCVEVVEMVVGLFNKILMRASRRGHKSSLAMYKKIGLANL